MTYVAQDLASDRERGFCFSARNEKQAVKHDRDFDDSGLKVTCRGIEEKTRLSFSSMLPPVDVNSR